MGSRSPCRRGVWALGLRCWPATVSPAPRGEAWAWPVRLLLDGDAPGAHAGERVTGVKPLGLRQERQEEAGGTLPAPPRERMGLLPGRLPGDQIGSKNIRRRRQGNA